MKDSPGIKNYRKIKAFPILRLLNTLSIDVIIGSVLSSLLAFKVLNIEPGWAFWFILPASVWTIYTLDHIIDAYRLKKQANTYRHNFHYKYIKPLIATIAVFSILNQYFIFYWLEKEIVYFGVVLSFVALVYLLLIHFSGNKNSFLPKEILVSIIYTCGIWGGPVALNNFNFTQSQLTLLIIFFLLVLSDVLLLSFYEIDSDKKDKHSTMAIIFGQAATKKIILTILLLVFVSSIFIIYTDNIMLHRMIAKLYLIMGLVQVFILEFPAIFLKNEIYRYFVEGIFWIPGLVLLL